MKHNPIVEFYCGCSVILCAVNCDMSNLCNLMKAIFVNCFGISPPSLLQGLLVHLDCIVIPNNCPAASPQDIQTGAWRHGNGMQKSGQHDLSLCSSLQYNSLHRLQHI